MGMPVDFASSSHAPNPNLTIQDGRADLDRTQPVAGEYQVQPGCVHVQLWRFGADAEFTRRGSGLGEVHGNTEAEDLYRTFKLSESTTSQKIANFPLAITCKPF